MVHKVNTKARIERHIRIYKEHGIKKTDTKKIMNNYHFNIVFFVVVVLFPIYPTLASFIHGNSQYEFYRWDIDEWSILESYYSNDSADDNVSTWDTPLVESNDSYISINTILDDTRDLTGTNEIVDYEVESWDSFGAIAIKFEVSTRSIYESNGFTSRHVLQPGDMIKIPPVSWLIHEVAKWDTVSTIAKKYKIKEEDILNQNLLSSQDNLKTGDVLVLPGAKKIIPKPVYKPKPKTITKYNGAGWYGFAAQANSKYTDNKWKYQLKWRKPFSWAWWNCTYYVASYKNVNWRWNANQWLRNASAKWHVTGSNPTLWAIVALDGRGYNRRYGHVAIVMEVLPSHIIVSDMNYRRLNEVTYRKIPRNDRAIQWYIYVD